MITYQVTTFDVWGNAEDGYDINNVFSAGKIEVEDDATTEQIWSALCEAGIADGDFSQAEFQDAGIDEYEIFERASGLPTFGLSAVA